MKSVPKYQINLDLPPSKRWVQMIKLYKDKLVSAVNVLEKMVPATILTTFYKNLALSTISLYSGMGLILHKEELESIAKTVGVPLNKVILVQILYEAFAACTSVTVPVDENKKNYHFRTMDWPFPFLKDITVELDFQKGGKTVYKSVSWVGYVGVMTGVRPGHYSVALNYRSSNGTIYDNIKKALSLKWPIGYLIRYALDNEMSYRKALRTFKSCELISPCYITMCNVAGRSHCLVRDASELKKCVRDKTVIQTNCDPDQIRGPNILFSFERRNLARNILKQNTFTNLKSVLHGFYSFPIINQDTIYTCVMEPQTGLILSVTA